MNFRTSSNSIVSHETESAYEEIMSVDILDLGVDQHVDKPEIVEIEDELPMPPVICYRDPADVRTIRRQSRLLLLALIVTATAVFGVVYKSIQRPDRIVVDMSSGRNRGSEAGERQAANCGHGLCGQDVS